jgi:hypothetical protein
MPVEVSTDRAATNPVVLELLPAAWHRTEQHANNQVEVDHGRLKARLRPMRGPKQDRSARVIIAGHAFVQNVRRGHYELAVEVPAGQRLTVAWTTTWCPSLSSVWAAARPRPSAEPVTKTRAISAEARRAAEGAR